MTDPILMSVATALATKAATGLYEFVKNKFSHRADDAAVLAKARDAKPDSPEVHALADALSRATAEDPTFAAGLHAQWQQVAQKAESGGVNNQVSGTVHGNVVQAGDITGGIHFGA
ncbi:MAG TPA: hypothetical protein VG317_17380 [Pseudonocardiaceae bacterium]|jgi:hypothetical protein|nr:hypothetical protein [Pseudonocardiaceae bacterium]